MDMPRGLEVGPQVRCCGMAVHRALELLDGWLGHLPPTGREWLSAALASVAAGDERALFISFSLAPRKLPRSDLQLSADERRTVGEALPGWRPWRWSLDQVARTRLLLAWPHADPTRYLSTLDRLFAAAGLQELVALYQALALLPHGPLLAKRAAEGVRSSMTVIFESVALDNPYPHGHLDEGAWNQLVLKCLFNGSDLSRVVGFDGRANPTLMRQLCGYAHERWAAHRSVDPLLWRGVGRFADAQALHDLQRVLGSGTPRERQAAALALRDCGSAAALAVLAAHPLPGAAAPGPAAWEQLTQGVS